MKKFWIIMVASLIFLSQTGCNSNDDVELPWRIEKSKKNITNETANISLIISNNGTTSRGIQLILLNKSTAEILLGRSYFIQILKDNVWYDIVLKNADWPLDLLVLPSDSEVLIKIDWFPIYGELPLGKYRIIKEYTLENSKSFVFCEFEIT